MLILVAYQNCYCCTMDVYSTWYSYSGPTATTDQQRNTGNTTAAARTNCAIEYCIYYY